MRRIFLPNDNEFITLVRRKSEPNTRRKRHVLTEANGSDTLARILSYLNCKRSSWAISGIWCLKSLHHRTGSRPPDPVKDVENGVDIPTNCVLRTVVADLDRPRAGIDRPAGSEIGDGTKN